MPEKEMQPMERAYWKFSKRKNRFGIKTDERNEFRTFVSNYFLYKKYGKNVMQQYFCDNIREMWKKQDFVSYGLQIFEEYTVYLHASSRILTYL